MAKNDKIKLSPKYGLNPSISVCFWCGKDKNELVLPGHIKKKNEKNSDIEAPHRAVWDYDPCPVCQSYMDKGITLIGASVDPVGENPEIQKGIYPTGKWMVITENMTRKIFHANVAKEAISARKAFCPNDVLDFITKKYKEDTGEDAPNLDTAK